MRKGDSGEEVKEMQELLRKHGYPVKPDGVFGPRTEKYVIKFQRKHRLYTDGVAGPITLEALKGEKLDVVKPTLKFEKVSCDKHDKGYDVTYLRSDAAEAFKKVMDEVHAAGGMITSSGGKRSLSASVGPNRSKTSFHYTGMAHDLYIYSGMVNPATDPYVVVKGSEHRRWIVYARAENGTSMTLKGYTYDHQEVTVHGKFINLTELFHKHGFSDIRARTSFINKGKNPLGAEWWHFQWDKHLTKGESTFGGELMKVYPVSTLEKYALWHYKDYVFGVNWF